MPTTYNVDKERRSVHTMMWAEVSGMGLLAAILFGVGLIGASLTPSHGQPSLVACFVYSVVPIVLTLVGFVARSWPVKIFLWRSALEFLL
jgi:hypothetical protein